MSSLKVHLLGRFELFDDGGEPLPPPATLNARSLLAYLIVHRDRPHPRGRLAGEFWGDRPEERARRSLSTALWHVRRCLPGDDLILSDHQTVQFNPEAELWLDTAAFEALISQGDPVSVREAVSLYEGPFLEGFYDDWIIDERYRLEALHSDALARLVAGYEAEGDYAATLAAALRLLEQDPLREEAHRAAMRAHGWLGRRNAALAQYRRCRELVEAELGTEPMAETKALYREIRDGRFDTGEIPTTPVVGVPTLVEGDGSSRYDPLGVGRASPLVGRREELTRLEGWWREAEAGRGRLVVVHGEAGIGKTRLVEALSGRVRGRGAWVVRAACYEYERTLPSNPLADVLRGVVATAGGGVLEELSSWQVADLARLAPELEARLPARARGLPPVDGGRTRQFHVLTSLLLRVARKNPLLLILEDLHWAHSSTLAWLHTLARRLAGEPLMLIGTYRPEVDAPNGGVSQLMRQLERRGMGSTLVLSRLSREDIGVWMDGASPEVVTSIYRHTEGNPFFVLETQRALCEAGELRLEESGWVATAPPADLPVPDSVRQVIEMRLSRLSAEVRRTLEAAAVVGRAFDLDVLARIRGQSEETMLEGLDELLRRRLVREGSGFFGKDYEFTHHLLREVVGERLDEARRRWLHGEVAEALVTLRSEEPAIDAEVAYHYIRAEDWGRAQTHLFRAGDHAAGVAADAEALRYYRRAMETYDLQSLGGGEEALLRRAILEHRMGECFFRRGEYEEALRHLKEALTVLGRPLPASKKAMRRATVGALMRQLGHRLVPFWPRTGSLDRNPAAVREEVDIYTFIGWIYALLAEHEAYLLVVLRALNASRRVGYARGEAVAAAALGTGLDFVPLFRVAGACHGRALNRAKRVEDVGAIGFVTQGLAYHSYLIGEEDAALDYARRSADAYQEAGDAHRWAVATLLMVYVHEHRGEFHRALAYARSLMEAGRETADQRTLCAGEEALGIIRLRQGHLKVAADHLRRTVALAEEIPDHMILVEARGELGRCMLQRGSWREAVGLLEATHRIADEHRVGGDSLGRFLNAMAGAYLVAVERDDEGSRADWLERARSACHAALKQSKGYRAGRPEAMRLRGTYEWLMGQPGAARRWWRRSRELADAMGHRYDRALTDLEMGARLGDEVLLQRAADRLDEIGAGWHVARAQRLLDRE